MLPLTTAWVAKSGAGPGHWSRGIAGVCGHLPLVISLISIGVIINIVIINIVISSIVSHNQSLISHITYPTNHKSTKAVSLYLVYWVCFLR